MTPVFVDFETFWSATHSIGKLGAMEYVMHPDTEIVSVSYKVGSAPTEVVFGEDAVSATLTALSWHDKYAIAHNMSAFDSMILAWRLGIRPAMWGCTAAMARPRFARDGGVSLRNVAHRLGVGDKDASALLDTKGKRLADFTAGEIAAMREYNKADTDLCAGVFRLLLPDTPRDELLLIDMTVRMLVDPQLVLDVGLLEETLAGEEQRKLAALNDVVNVLGVVDAEAARAELASTAKFAKFLAARSVTVPMKTSPRTGAMIPALAKTDEAFVALLDHPDPHVAAVVAQRLDVRSTILESRIKAFLSAAGCAGGMLPAPLHYYGAANTGRWSGWAINIQNLPRVDPTAPKASDALRHSLRAPAGYKVVVADLSGIELRVNMFLWRVPYAMETLYADPAKADLYKVFAAMLYDKPVADVTKAERQIGKLSMLGLGYSAGANTFANLARAMGGVALGEDDAERIVRAYRSAHAEVVQGWRKCHAAIAAIHAGDAVDLDEWGLLQVVPGEGIRTPGGMLRYPHLRREESDDGRVEWVYGRGRDKARLYGGKVVENVVQHLARNVIAGQALAINRHPLMQQYGYRPAFMVHDELVYVVREEHADSVLSLVLTEMRSVPEWWPELPLWAEGDVADTYGAAK